MGVTDLFSTRNQHTPDVFVYDTLPKALRAQIVHILTDTLTPSFYVKTDSGWSRPGWAWLAKQVAHVQGILNIPRQRHQQGSDFADCMSCILSSATSLVLDMVELSMRIADGTIPQDHDISLLGEPFPLPELTAESAISELNGSSRVRVTGDC